MNMDAWPCREFRLLQGSRSAHHHHSAVRGPACPPLPWRLAPGSFAAYFCCQACVVSEHPRTDDRKCGIVGRQAQGLIPSPAASLASLPDFRQGRSQLQTDRKLRHKFVHAELRPKNIRTPSVRRHWWLHFPSAGVKACENISQSLTDTFFGLCVKSGLHPRRATENLHAGTLQRHNCKQDQLRSLHIAYTGALQRLF